VVYEDSDSTRKQIFINDNFDLLGASSEYGTTSAQATAYVPFTGMTIDTADMKSATLTTFVPSGDSHEGNILYNGNVLASNIWNWGGTGTGTDGGKQVAVDSREVKSSIQATGNTFAIQSTDNGGTPCMAAIQQFLVIDLGDSTSTTTTTTTTTTSTVTTTGTVTAATPTPTGITVSSSQGTTSNGKTGSTGSNSGNPGTAGNPVSGQQGNQYKGSPVEEPDKLAGETSAAGASGTGTIPEGFPPNLIIGSICMIGFTSVYAYRNGWIPPVQNGGFTRGKNGMCTWKCAGNSSSCLTFDLSSGVIRYHNPRFAKLSRTHLILIGLVLAGIVIAGSAWSFGFLSSGSYGPLSSSGDMQNGNFDLIPTIENIQDLDMTNHAPDYPAGFSARNGLLFVYHGTEKHAVLDLELELAKGTNTAILTSSTVPPSANAVNGRLSSYFEEMGNGNGILEPEEWLMVYSDNCYDSSRADGEPKGKVLVWQPQDSVSRIEVPLKDTVGYSLKDTAAGTLLQQGTVMLVPTTA
jgi:hypothetical protein